MPDSSSVLQTSGALMDSWSQPTRILAVTGTWSPTALATPDATLARSGQSFSSDDPPFFETTLFTGQPKLMSMKSGCFQSMIFLAASPMRMPSAPKIWIPSGRCSSLNSVYFLVYSSRCMMPSAETNSVTTTSAPSSLQMVLNTTSVTPAMGAR